jgi:ABC-2 type transport system permease protein
MTFAILRHEWRGLRADATLWLLIVVFGLSIGYGVLNGARWVRFQTQAVADAQREEHERHAAREAEIQRINSTNAKVSPFADPRNPDAAGRRMASRYAAMPPAPLASLSIGQSDLLPAYFRMTLDSKETVLAATELENPDRLLTGRFDLAFVVIYLYPLLILALSYNLLSVEKEQGTLALALSQPLSLRTLLLAKVGLRALVFLVIVVGFALVTSVATGLRLASGSTFGLFAAWVVIVAAYGAFWFAIALAVTALGRSSSTNAMLLAGIWLLLTVLAPSALNLVTTTLYPVPSRVEMVQAFRVASEEANAESAKVLGRYYQDHPELVAGSPEQAMKDFYTLRVIVNEDVERRVRTVVERYDQQAAAQQQTIDRLRFLSPAILTQDALNDVAGSGTARHRHFRRQAETYHAAWRAFFVPKILQKAQLDSYRDVPVFHYQEEASADVIGRAAISVIGLVLPTLAIGWLGLRGLRRYPVAG